MARFRGVALPVSTLAAAAATTQVTANPAVPIITLVLGFVLEILLRLRKK